MGNGKPRGLNAARKLRVHRRNKYVIWIKTMVNGYTEPTTMTWAIAKTEHLRILYDFLLER